MITYACPVAKPEYTPPELQGKHLSSIVRTPEQDAFGLGVLIFQLLMEGNHSEHNGWEKAIPRRSKNASPSAVSHILLLQACPYARLNILRISICFIPDHRTDPRCFIDGHRDPHQRPGASAWERAIAEAEKASFSALTSTFIQTTSQRAPNATPSV